jgi:hypothetical protein
VDDRDGWHRRLADGTGDRASRPRQICQLCVQELGVSGAGISMVTAAGNRGVVCATDDLAAQIEDLQLTLGEGPCMDAAQTGAPVLVPDLDEPDDLVVERWPAFLEGAAAAGVRAVFAFPMRIGAISVGVLDLYRDRPGDLVGDSLPAALMAADAAALSLLHLDAKLPDTFLDDLSSRSSFQLQVHQATGMVQVQLGVSTEDVFLMLRARAFATSRRLVDVASEIVQRHERFSKEDP